jgi:methylated-DNA-[protein]-cysteine S-methyltransferase
MVGISHSPNMQHGVAAPGSPGLVAGGEDISAAAKQWKLDAQHPILRLAAKQLQEYFAGEREALSVPLRLAGTDFQQRIWREIARIPCGQTLSYSDLANRAGAPRAFRAAGTSTGRNPAAIFVPCHRVVGKNGSMCGFGGGLDRKRFLLGLENPGLHPDSARPGVEPG